MDGFQRQESSSVNGGHDNQAYASHQHSDFFPNDEEDNMSQVSDSRAEREELGEDSLENIGTRTNVRSIASTPANTETPRHIERSATVEQAPPGFRFQKPDMRDLDLKGRNREIAGDNSQRVRGEVEADNASINQSGQVPKPGIPNLQSNAGRRPLAIVSPHGLSDQLPRRSSDHIQARVVGSGGLSSEEFAPPAPQNLSARPRVSDPETRLRVPPGEERGFGFPINISPSAQVLEDLAASNVTRGQPILTTNTERGGPTPQPKRKAHRMANSGQQSRAARPEASQEIQASRSQSLIYHTINYGIKDNLNLSHLYEGRSQNSAQFLDINAKQEFSSHTGSVSRAAASGNVMQSRQGPEVVVEISDDEEEAGSSDDASDHPLERNERSHSSKCTANGARLQAPLRERSQNLESLEELASNFAEPRKDGHDSRESPASKMVIRGPILSGRPVVPGAEREKALITRNPTAPIGNGSKNGSKIEGSKAPSAAARTNSQGSGVQKTKQKRNNPNAHHTADRAETLKRSFTSAQIMALAIDSVNSDQGNYEAEAARLKESEATLKDTVRCLREDLKIHKDQHVEQREELHKQAQQIGHYVKESAGLQKCLEEVTHDKTILQEAVKELQSKLRVATDEREDLKAKRNEDKRMLEKLTDEIQSYEVNERVWSEANRQMEVEHQNRTKQEMEEKREMEQQLHKVQATVAHLREELSEKVGLLAEERNRTARLESDVARHCERYDEFQNRAAENQKSLMEKLDEMVMASKMSTFQQKTEEELTVCTSILTALQRNEDARLDPFTDLTNLTNTIFNRICERLIEVQDQGERGRQNLEDVFRNGIEELSIDRNSIQELQKQLRGALAERISDSNSIEELVRLLGQEIIELKADAKSVRVLEEELVSLRELSAAMTERLEQKEVVIASLRGDVAASGSESRLLKEKITSLQIDAAHQQAAQPQHDPGLVTVVAALQKDNDGLKEKLIDNTNAHKVDQDIAAQMATEMRREIRILKERITTLDQEKAVSEQEAKKAREESVSLVADTNIVHQREIYDLRNQIQQFKTATSRADAAAALAKRQQQSTQKKFDTLEQGLARARDSMEASSSKIALLEAGNINRDAKIENYESNIRKLSEQLDSERASHAEGITTLQRHLADQKELSRAIEAVFRRNCLLGRGEAFGVTKVECLITGLIRRNLQTTAHLPTPDANVIEGNEFRQSGGSGCSSPPIGQQGPGSSIPRQALGKFSGITKSWFDQESESELSDAPTSIAALSQASPLGNAQNTGVRKGHDISPNDHRPADTGLKSSMQVARTLEISTESSPAMMPKLLKQGHTNAARGKQTNRVAAPPTNRLDGARVKRPAEAEVNAVRGHGKKRAKLDEKEIPDSQPSPEPTKAPRRKHGRISGVTMGEDV